MGEEPTVPFFVFRNFPLHITAPQSEFYSVVCQLAWTHLATLPWPPSSTMHFCPRSWHYCQDVFVCVCCLCISWLDIHNAWIPRCGVCLSDSGATASLIIIPYSKWLKCRVLPIPTFGWTETEPLDSVCLPYVLFTNHSVWEGKLFA